MIKDKLFTLLSALVLLSTLGLTTLGHAESEPIEAVVPETLLNSGQEEQEEEQEQEQETRDSLDPNELFAPRALGSLGRFERFTRINEDGSIRDPQLLPKGYVIAVREGDSLLYHNDKLVVLGNQTLSGGTVRITNVGRDASGRGFDSIIELLSNVLTTSPDGRALRLINSQTSKLLRIKHVYSDDSPVLVPVLLSFYFSSGTTIEIENERLYTVLGDTIAEEKGTLTPKSNLGVDHYVIRPGSGEKGGKNPSTTNIIVSAEVSFLQGNEFAQGGLNLYEWNGLWADVDTPAPVVTGANVPNFKERAQLFEISQQIPRSTENGKFSTFSVASQLNPNLIVAPADIDITDSAGADLKGEFNISIVDHLLRVEAKDTSKDNFYDRFLKIKVSGTLDMAKSDTWGPQVTAQDELFLPAVAETLVDEKPPLESNVDNIVFSGVKLPSKVTVKFEDLEGNPLADELVTNYEYGETYTATAKDLSANGWTLEDPDVTSQTGLVGYGSIEVVFKYRKGQVTVLTEYYQKDQEGNLTQLFPTASATYEYHTLYETISKEAEALVLGYVLESSDTGHPISDTTGNTDETLTVNYVYVDGTISLTVPELIDFGETQLISSGTKERVPTENIKVSIMDQLPKKWDLLLGISEAITSERDQTAIKGQFSFIQNDGTSLNISEGPKVIHSKQAVGVIEGLDLEWDAGQNKGLVFKQLPGNKQGSYSGTFTWTLQDAY